MGGTTSLARQVAELTESAPADFDPEENAVVESSDEGSGSQDSDDELLGTEHYVEVGKSKLRKRDEIALGPEYVGSRVSRKALQDDSDKSPSFDYGDSRESLEADAFADLDTVGMDVDVDDEDGDIDSDEAFGESDAEKFKKFTFRGSETAREITGASRERKTAADFMTDDKDEGSDLTRNENGSSDNEDGEELDSSSDQFEEDGDSSNGAIDESIHQDDQANGTESESESEDDEESDDTDDRDEATDDEKSRRAELRKIMNEEQKSVVATISQAAKADAQKGNAVKLQRKTFDSLLNVRIRLQKALIASNSMAATTEKDGDAKQPYQAAEEAAIKLLNTLDAMREELNKADSSANTGAKRKRTVDVGTPSSAIWENMQNSESKAIGTRQATLEKWSAKVRDVTALPVSGKLNNTVMQQTISDVLQEQLFNSERLVKRTKMPRSCAPVQAKMKVTEDPNIFDDADFYQLLLKELVDQRMMDSSTASVPAGADGRPVAQWTAIKEAKTKRNVDTKASKGRKMRYTVHEKLQNFMAPEDRASWEQDAVDRFFGTLLGQKMDLEEDRDVSDEGDEAMPLAEEALMLFRS